MSNDVLLNIPVEYRKKMAYITFDEHSTYAKITCETNLFRIITLFYPFLNRDEVSEIISYYSKSGLSNDKLEFLFDSLTKNNDFYKLLIELKNKCFNNVSETINFIRKYKTTNLYRELNELSEVDDELKQKLIFLSSANRLKGISSLEDINKVSIDELKNIKNDDEYVSNIRINVDPHAHKNDNKFKVFNHKRSIVLIDSDETFEEFEVNLSHLDIIKRIYIEKDIPYYKLDEHKMYYNLALMDYVVMVIDEDTIAIYFPSKLGETQKEILIDRFSDVSKNELYISAGFVDEDHKYFLINPLNNGEFMDRNKFLDELNRINCKEKNRN